MKKLADGTISMIAWIESGGLPHGLKEGYRVATRRSERVMREWIGINLSGLELCRAVIERADAKRSLVL